MKKPNLKQIETLGVVFSLFIGTLLHFTYQISNNNKFVALFSAVNESVWEHTKMYFFPILLFLIFEWQYIKDKKSLLLAKVLENIWGITFIIAFYYTSSGAFGFHNVFLDILSFYFAIFIGKLISYFIISSKANWRGYTILHVLVLFLITIFFFVVTFIPPKVPLFKDNNTNIYGLGEKL